MKKKKLTKWTLIWRRSKEFTGGMSLIIAVGLLGFTVMNVIYHNPLSISIQLSVLYLIGMYFIVFIVVLSLTAKGLFLLHRQERLFGIRFSDEDIDPDHLDRRWFITKNGYLLAFRRGFISKTGKIHRLYNNGLSEMYLWDCEGERHKVRCHYLELEALKTWLKEE